MIRHHNLLKKKEKFTLLCSKQSDVIVRVKNVYIFAVISSFVSLSWISPTSNNSHIVCTSCYGVRDKICIGFFFPSFLLFHETCAKIQCVYVCVCCARTALGISQVDFGFGSLFFIFFSLSFSHFLPSPIMKSGGNNMVNDFNNCRTNLFSVFVFLFKQKIRE